MDGRTRYNKTAELLKPLVGETVHMNSLRYKVMTNIGTSDKLIRDTLRFMIETGLITEIDHLIFRVNKAEI